jgi:hypothetical protein
MSTQYSSAEAMFHQETKGVGGFSNNFRCKASISSYVERNHEEQDSEMCRIDRMHGRL